MRLGGETSRSDVNMHEGYSSCSLEREIVFPTSNLSGKPDKNSSEHDANDRVGSGIITSRFMVWN